MVNVEKVPVTYCVQCNSLIHKGPFDSGEKDEKGEVKMQQCEFVCSSTDSNDCEKEDGHVAEGDFCGIDCHDKWHVMMSKLPAAPVAPEA